MLSTWFIILWEKGVLCYRMCLVECGSKCTMTLLGAWGSRNESDIEPSVPAVQRSFARVFCFCFLNTKTN